MYLNSIIIDDEASSRDTLRNMLEKYCTDIKVSGAAGNIEEGIKLIFQNKPDLVFLDIELPEQSGFDLFNYFEQPDFDVIFTTAYSEYAVKAFRLSAIDYLLKPIDLELLRHSLDKFREKQQLSEEREKYNILRENLNNVLKKLSLPSLNGYEFVELKDIVRCEAEGNYTKFHFTNGKTSLISKTLKTYADLLADFNFFRVNRSHVINLTHIAKYERQRNPVIEMVDGSLISIPETRKIAFFDALENS